MSALGQKQTCAAQKVMSALPPIADIASLFDDFIGAAEHRRWECETHCLGGLKIDQ